MTPELMALLIDHATGVATFTPPAQWYVAYFFEGAEISGGSYSRKPIDFAAAVELDETQVRAGNSNDVPFADLPTEDVDEAHIVNTASGAITLTGWILPYLRSFTAGDDNTHAADDIAVGFTTS